MQKTNNFPKKEFFILFILSYILTTKNYIHNHLLRNTYKMFFYKFFAGTREKPPKFLSKCKMMYTKVCSILLSFQKVEGTRKDICQMTLKKHKKYFKSQIWQKQMLKWRLGCRKFENFKKIYNNWQFSFFWYLKISFYLWKRRKFSTDNFLQNFSRHLHFLKKKKL